MQADHIQSSSPLCNEVNYSEWTWYIDAFSFGAFATTIAIYLTNLGTSYHMDMSLNLTFSAGAVSMLACISSIMTLTVNWGGVCIDYFGFVNLCL